MINWKIILFVGKKQIQKNGCQNSVAIVMSMLTYTAPRLFKMFPDILAKSQSLLAIA